MEELKEVATIMRDNPQVTKIKCGKMGHFARECQFKWKTTQGNTAAFSNLEDDREEEWAVELCLAMIKLVEEAVEEEAMLTVSKEIEEKIHESIRGQSWKDQSVTNELQSFEDEGEPEQKPNPEYANVAVIEDGSIQELSTYEEASQREEWRKAMEEEIQALK